MTDCPHCGQANHKKKPCIPVAQRLDNARGDKRCKTCHIEFDGEHPTFLGGTPRQHVTCEYCAVVPERYLPDPDSFDWNGLYGPGRGWLAHGSSKRHLVAARIGGMVTASLLDRLPLILDHNALTQKAVTEGHTVHFDLAADPA